MFKDLKGAWVHPLSGSIACQCFADNSRQASIRLLSFMLEAQAHEFNKSLVGQFKIGLSQIRRGVVSMI